MLLLADVTGISMLETKQARVQAAISMLWDLASWSAETIGTANRGGFVCVPSPPVLPARSA